MLAVGYQQELALKAKGQKLKAKSHIWQMSSMNYSDQII